MDRTMYKNLSALIMVFAWASVTPARAVLPDSKVAIQHSVRRGTTLPRAGATTGQTTGVAFRPMAVLPTPLAPATSQVGFLTVRQISPGAGTVPIVSILGDFRGNSHKDVASIVQDANSQYWLSILLSNGDGTFASPVLTSVSFGSYDLIAAGDLNGDGKTDIVLAHANSVDVLIGDGTGHFAAAANYTTSVPTPVALTLMKNNGDSSLDVIVANGTADFSGKSPVVSLFGNGDGTLGAASTSHYNGTMAYGVFADLNGDGQPDLVSDMQVFLGTSGGDYLTPASLHGTASTCAFPFGAPYGSVIAADINGDGHPDILTADCSNQTITAFVNAGNGTFSASKTTWAGYLPATVSVADVNGDGHLDAIVGDFYSMDVMVLIGNNDGTFTAPSLGYAVGGDLWTAPVVADFNSDGKADVIMPSGIMGQWENLIYLAGLGGGAFVAPHDYFYAGGAPATLTDSWGIATADLNNDGLPDFVVGNLGSDPNVGVTVYLSNPPNQVKALLPGVNYGSGGNLRFVALADVDGDGKLDIVASNTVPGSVVQGDVQVFRGNGNGTFQTTPVTIPVVSGSGLGHLVVADFNGDHKPDIAVLDTGSISNNQTFIGHVWILVNNSVSGSPAFAPPVSYPLISAGWEIAAGDLGNGHTDLVITQAQSTAVSVLMGDGTGGFTAQPDFDLQSFFPAGLTLAKLNPSSSAHLDLIVTIDDSNAGMGVAVASGNGDGTFGAPVLYPATSDTTGTVIPFPADVRVADLDGDGNLDLVFTNFGDGAVGVLYGTGQFGNGQSSFYEPVEFPVNGGPVGLLLADVNGDGALDAVVDGSGFASVTALLNTGANNVTLSSNLNPSNSTNSVTFTATVAASPVPGGPVASPTGSVVFNDNLSGNLGTATVSGGVATISTSSLTVGTHVVTATYLGNTNLVGQTKATVVQNVNNGATLGYTLSAAPTSATLHPGQSATFTITGTPNIASFGTVNFACGTLPAGVTCLFNPSSITFSGLGSRTATLTVTVAPTFIASTAPGASQNIGGFAGTAFGLLGSVALGAFRRAGYKRWSWVMAIVAVAMMLAATGCGGSGSNPVTAPKVTAVMVTATSQSPGGTQRLNLTLNIQP